MTLRYSTKAARTAAALFFAGAAAAACTGAAQAQNALIPPALTVPRHVPARLPQPDSAQPALPLAADGTFIPGPSLFSGARTAWMQPHASSVAAFGLPPFSSVGPSTILNAGGGVGVAYQPVAGRVVAVAPDPTNSSIIYIAAAGGGVWKTTDGGASWTALTDGLPDLAMGSLAVDPSSPSTIYAGSGEANFAGDSRYGEGLYKSTNGGASWTVYTGPNNVFAGLAISKIVVDPTNSGVVYLTTARAANGTRTGYGVYKSTDGGASWALVFNGGGPFTDLAIDPSNTQTLYAAAGEIFGNANNGIYKSTNGGSSWTLLTGFPNSTQSGNNVGRIALALAPSNPQVLYADYSSNGSDGSVFGSLGGFYSTQNGGATWTAAPKSTDGFGSTGVPNFLGGQGWYDNTIVVSPTNASEVFAAGVVNYAPQDYGQINGLIGSFDGGNTWSDYSVGHNNSGPHTDHHALAFTPGGSALLNGNDGGMWRLENPNTAPNTYDPSASSVSWSNLNTNLAITQFTGIALHPTDATIAYGGSQDNGTEKFTGSTQWTQVRTGDGGFTRVDQTNPQTVYHEYFGAVVDGAASLERSDDGGATWTGKDTGINPNDPVLDGSDPSAFYVPYVLDPANQSRVVYGTDHVYESLNKGDAFTAIGTPGVNGFNTADNTIGSIATLGNTIYAAAGGVLYATSNDGATWVSRGTPSGGSISDIYINPNTPLDVTITRGRFGGGHVFRSNDGGATFKDISGNLPNEPFSAVKVDRRSGTMYAGADDGVYTTTNFGGTWVKSNLPNVQVVDLAVSRGAGIVGAGTHGRGLFEASLPTTVATPNLIVNAALSRAVAGGPVTITLTLKDINNADETNTVVSTVALNNQPAVVVTPGTDTVGTVPAQGQAPTVAYQSATPPASGTRAVLRVTGTSTQGNFTASLKVVVP